ncbi:MAG: hypothetical protein FJZ57_05345 [Chlamydiae bacterium]|nr:hypothetical protein [Chlamydiota bacterium]
MTTSSHITNNYNPYNLIPERASSANEMSNEKIKKIALYTLGSVTVAAGAALIGLSCASVIAPGIAFVSIPLFVGAAVSFYYAHTTLDYNDAADVKKMRNQAANQSFSKIVETHGFDKTIQYKIQTLDEMSAKFKHEFRDKPCSTILHLKHRYFPKSTNTLSLRNIIELNLMSREEIQQKFKLELISLDLSSCSETFNAKALTDLFECNIIDTTLFNRITSIYRENSEASQSLSRTINQIREKYPRRQELLLKELDLEKDKVTAEADKQLRNLKELRNAETEMELSMRRRPKHGTEIQDFVQEQNARAFRDAVNNITSRPMEMAAIDFRDRQHRFIEDRKREILSLGTGKREQDLYIQELNTAKSEYRRGMQDLETRFSIIKNEI